MDLEVTAVLFIKLVKLLHEKFFFSFLKENVMIGCFQINEFINLFCSYILIYSDALLEYCLSKGGFILRNVEPYIYIWDFLR